MTVQRELDPIACFLTACEIERREYRASRRERKVVNGRRISAEGGRFLYAFDLQDDAEVREETPLQLVVGAAFYQGTVCYDKFSSVPKGHCGRSVTIALASDLGPYVPSARIETQEQDLLQALILRLKELRDLELRGPTDNLGWNDSIARRVLRLQKIGATSAEPSQVKPPDDLTVDQSTALVRCLLQPVTYVWGPPGTGKTVLLAAIALQLYQDNKRVLIVSHTNHAVDGVVESICKRIMERDRRTAVAEASILRVGTMVRESLIKRYADQVSLDAVINKSHEKVSSRLAALTRELSEVRDELFNTSRKIAFFDTYQQLRADIDQIRNSDTLPDEAFVESIDRVVNRTEMDRLNGESPSELIDFMSECLERVAGELQGCDKLSLEHSSVELSGRQLELSEAIAVLEKFVRDLRISLLDRARIVATTATHAMLSARELAGFDAVLIDEASMLPLPLCFLLSGRARERVVIAGDFRQLPAIARSDSPVVKKWYSRDVFECAGVVDLVDERRDNPAVVTLTTQFRSHETLCGLINNRFYGGILRTKTDSAAERYIYRDPLAYLNRSPVVLVDTSELAPWGELQSGSKLNFVHALIVRKLSLLLSAHGVALLPDALGVIVPYRAQADLIRCLLEECSLGNTVSVGTVHKFQGSEREAIVLDLTESPPHVLGGFLNPHSLRDSGARLLNVALSRARRHMIVVANLKHLRSQVQMTSLMRGILDDLERVGYKLPAADVIGEQIFSTPSREMRGSSGVLAFQAFDAGLFLPALVTDLVDARAEIVISTEGISERVATVVSALLEGQIARGVRVLIRYNSSRMSTRAGQAILHRLGQVGIVLLPLASRVPPAVVVDSEVLWLGAIAPLDSLDGASGVMTRAVSVQAAQRTLSVLKLYGSAPFPDRVAL